MSEQVTPVVVATSEVSSAPVAGQVAPAQKLNAIQMIEQELGAFLKQREQAIANVHAVEGAIQAAQHLLGKLRVEAAKVEKVVEGEVSKVIEFVQKTV